MTTTWCTDGVASPKGGLMSWIRNRRARAACRASLAELPHYLRRDIGADGGLPLARHEDGGRVFIVNGRPDSMDSHWHL